MVDPRRPDMADPDEPFDRSPTPIFDAIARFANRRWASAVLALWGFGEAIVLPVVPDVLLYLLAFSAPRRAAPLFGWVVAGALVGSVVLAVLTLGRPDLARSTVMSVPGIDQAMVFDAQFAVRDGDPLAMAHFGPGTPLKVYTFAWWTGPRDGLEFVVGVVVNRLERIGPGVLLLAIAGALAPAWLRRRELVLLAGYALFWVAFYALWFGGGGG